MPSPTLALMLPSMPARTTRTQAEVASDLAIAADDAGVDKVLLVGQPVLGPAVDRDRQADAEGNQEGPLALLAKLAERTQRIRLGAQVVITTLRGGAVLAGEAARIDVVSGGRLDLTVGPVVQRPGLTAGRYPQAV